MAWNPVTRHSERMGPICLLGKFSTATTWRPISSSAGFHNENGEVALCVPDREVPLGTKLL